MNDQNKRIFLRSQEWFDDPEHADMTALYVERYMNYGLTRAELQSGRPIIGIAQTGSDLTPCNRHHKELAERVKAGIRDAGGVFQWNSLFTRLQNKPVVQLLHLTATWPI